MFPKNQNCNVIIGKNLNKVWCDQDMKTESVAPNGVWKAFDKPHKYPFLKNVVYNSYRKKTKEIRVCLKHLTPITYTTHYLKKQTQTSFERQVLIILGLASPFCRRAPPHLWRLLYAVSTYPNISPLYNILYQLMSLNNTCSKWRIQFFLCVSSLSYCTII